MFETLCDTWWSIYVLIFFRHPIDNQIKRDQPTGETPGRVSRKFPRSIIQGTPDDIRKARFRQVYDTTGKDVRANMDFESADSDLLEDETPEVESADDTRDSVVSFSRDSLESLAELAQLRRRVNILQKEHAFVMGIFGVLLGRISGI